MEERAAKFGTVADRAQVATRRDDAHRRDAGAGGPGRRVRHAAWFDYFQHTAAFPQMDVGSSAAVREMVDFVNDSGLGSIGTADMACEQIERLQKQSGGFGCYMSARPRVGQPARPPSAATS